MAQEGKEGPAWNMLTIYMNVPLAYCIVKEFKKIQNFGFLAALELSDAGFHDRNTQSNVGLKVFFTKLQS